MLDHARAAQQRRELERLIKSWLPMGAYAIDAERDREYPYSQLMAELQIGVETDPRSASRHQGHSTRFGCPIAIAIRPKESWLMDKTCDRTMASARRRST